MSEFGVVFATYAGIYDMSNSAFYLLHVVQYISRQSIVVAVFQRCLPKHRPTMDGSTHKQLVLSPASLISKSLVVLPSAYGK